MLINQSSNTYSFKGTTAIRAVTDSHQEAKNEAAILSKIAEDARKQDNILLLNGGDLYGGVYSRDLMVDLYKTFKQQNPNVEVVMTVGNNDFISQNDRYTVKGQNDKRTPLEFFFESSKKLQDAGINLVCANLKDKSTKDCPSWVEPYKVVERDGNRIFVTGFCIDRIPKDKLNIDVISQKDAFDNLKKDIKRENPDSIIVLNHDYTNKPEELFNYAKEQGIKIDLFIGAHDHDHPKQDSQINMYSPKPFSKSMFEMDLQIKDKVSKILNPKEIETEDLDIAPEYQAVIGDYEKESGMQDKLSPHILNLPKNYSDPGALGTFIADGIKDMAGTDVAFFASNAVRLPIYYKKGKNVVNADVRRTITFDSTIQKGELSVDGFKEVLNSALENRVRLGRTNARFLQCSSNIKIIGEGNSQDKSYSIKQIYLNDEPLLDEKGNAIDSNRKISCAFDNFIPTDGRSSALQNADKKDVMTNSVKLRLDEVLKRQLQGMEGKYEKGTTYPEFQLVEIIE